MKKTKLALMQSVVALLLCVAMLIGSTFAWFTDSVTSGINHIVAGNLDVELEYRNQAGAWKPLTEDTNVFAENANWEPGYTEVVYLRVSNKGNLALKYQLGVNIVSETPSINVNGQPFRLSQFIHFGAVADQADEFASRTEAVQAVTSSKLISDGYSKQNALQPRGEQYVALVVYMPESVGNAANHATGQDVPTINLGISLVATQYTSESDSFDSTYDDQAQFPVLNLADSVSATAVKDVNNKVAQALTMASDDNSLSAKIPVGVQMDADTDTLLLTVREMTTSGANITLGENEILRSLDVHIAGVAANNTVPMQITIAEAMMPGLNIGNYKIYHMDKGVKVQMTSAATLAELDAHNEFYYDPATGDMTLSLATFSEVALVADIENKWNGAYVEGFAGGTGTQTDPYLIANADQLAYLGEVISNDNENYGNKHYKLLVNINLGGEENANDGKIFYPIGYHKVGNPIASVDVDDAPEFLYFDEDPDYARNHVNTVTGEGATTWYTYGGAFQGTFDGNGHKISNIYQNTWQLKGNYSGNYWNAAMGLFGYVYGGTVKNLTVENFQSDGEFTPTGVIAAYAAASSSNNAVFENIAIVNCNPRVYNTGNGGIVGIGGNSSDTSDKKMLFTNITVDNTNKISALWGSWDVACGGLMGMFRGRSLVHFENCHVGAQIDVFNDVCGNYQYYWYRYSGMVIGSLRGRNTTDAKGYTVPDMSGITAKNCTVHFGEWNNYYYCELVANSLASYTHDHQFSRLTQIQNVSEIQDANGNWNTTGNFILMNGKTPTATCYHIVKDANGNLTEHKHEDAGTETVNGQTVLKENNQRVFLPFNQLFQGDGWGVKHVPVYNGENYAFSGITILDRESADSVKKFDGKVEKLTSDTEIKIGDIFSSAESGVDIVNGSVTVTVTNLDENNPVSAVFTRGSSWENGTLKLDGIGKVLITIQDYYFCTPTTIEVEVVEREPEYKFESKLTGDFLYRVGNASDSPVALSSLFTAISGANIGDVSVTVETLNGTAASGTYTPNATWTNGTIQFSGTGLVKVTITDNDRCKPTELILEVVDAVNATSAIHAKDKNVVLLNNVSASSLEISNGYSFYGNGFTITFDGDGSYRSAAVSYGFVTLSNGGTLDHARVVCKVFPKSYMFTNEMTAGSDGRYPYGYSAIIMSGNSTVSNCYVHGARNNILVSDGNALISNTVTESGSLSNIQVLSSSSYTVTLDNVTTIQYQTTSPFDASAKILGFGVVVGLPDSTSNATIKLTGDFNQYNWVTSADTSVSNTYTKSAIEGALKVSKYQHTNSAGATTVNTGIAYMNNLARNIIDERTNTAISYEGNSVSISGYTGYVYSIINKTGNPDAEIDRGQFANGTVAPTVSYGKTQSNSITLNTAFDANTNRWISTLSLDLDTLGSHTFNFSDLLVRKYGINLNYEVKDANGNAVNKATAISLSQLYNAEYRLVITDNQLYNNKGELTGNSVKTEIVFVIHATKTSIEPPKFTGIGTGTAIKTHELSGTSENWRPAYRALENVSVSYWSASQGKTVTVDLSTLNTAGSISGNVWTYTCDDYTLTITGGAVHSDGSKISPKVVSNVLYFWSADKAFGTGTTTRDIILTYVFTDKNDSTTQEFKTQVSHSNLGQYKKSKFASGTLEAGKDSGICVTPDTLVTMADGSKKEIQDVRLGDLVMVWNFTTGKYEAMPTSLLQAHSTGNMDVLYLTFEDGTVLKILGEHGVFDADLNTFVFLDQDDVMNYVGHEFVKAEGDSFRTVKLVSYEVRTEYTTAYTILSTTHYNVMLEDMFTVTPAHIGQNFFNPFNIGEDMTYNADQVSEDIAKYGLYTYEDFAHLVTYEQFVALNLAQFKVSVGKGYVTYEGLCYLIQAFVNNSDYNV